MVWRLVLSAFPWLLLWHTYRISALTQINLRKAIGGVKAMFVAPQAPKEQRYAMLFFFAARVMPLFMANPLFLYPTLHTFSVLKGFSFDSIEAPKGTTWHDEAFENWWLSGNYRTSDPSTPNPLYLFWFTTLFVFSCGSRKNHQMCTNHLKGPLAPFSWLLRETEIFRIENYSYLEPENVLHSVWKSPKLSHTLNCHWTFVPKIKEIFMKLSLMKFFWKIQTLCAQMTSTVTFFAAIFQLISLADVRWKSAR